MAAKRNWLVGCGVGCALLLLVAIAIPAGCALFLGNAMQDFDQAVADREALEERFGTADAFRPWPGGTVPADRVEAFLRVREASQPAREQLSGRFTTLFSAVDDAREIEDKGFFEKLRFGLGMARTGVGMAPDIGTFFEARNGALLDVEMGLGEYSYLYDLAYYGLLQHSPGAGPTDAVDSAELDKSGVDVDTGMNNSAGRVRRELRAMLRRQLEALPPDADPDWRAALTAEVAALEAERGRFPWQHGLPEPLAASLAPYRDRLEATWDPATNPFELARNEKRGPFSYSTD